IMDWATFMLVSKVLLFTDFDVLNRFARESACLLNLLDIFKSDNDSSYLFLSTISQTLSNALSLFSHSKLEIKKPNSTDSITPSPILNAPGKLLKKMK